MLSRLVPFDGFLSEEHLRLVMQRTRVGNGNPSAESEGLFGIKYVYRCILTNDRENSEGDIIAYYNWSGAFERNFDCQNNDFGWFRLSFSYLRENTVFLFVTAMLKNFYQFVLRTVGPPCLTRKSPTRIGHIEEYSQFKIPTIRLSVRP